MDKRESRIVLKLYKRMKRIEARLEALEKCTEDRNAEALRRYWAKYPNEKQAPSWITEDA